jgi:hypothetical protein
MSQNSPQQSMYNQSKLCDLGHQWRTCSDVELNQAILLKQYSSSKQTESLNWVSLGCKLICFFWATCAPTTDSHGSSARANPLRYTSGHPLSTTFPTKLCLFLQLSYVYCFCLIATLSSHIVKCSLQILILFTAHFHTFFLLLFIKSNIRRRSRIPHVRKTFKYRVCVTSS